MKLFKDKPAVIIIVLSVSFLGLIVYTTNRDNRNLIENIAGSTLNPAESIIYNGTNKIKETLDFILNFSEVKIQNKELITKNQELENKLATYSDLKDENDRLRKYLTSQKKEIIITI